LALKAGKVQAKGLVLPEEEKGECAKILENPIEKGKLEGLLILAASYLLAGRRSTASEPKNVPTYLIRSAMPGVTEALDVRTRQILVSAAVLDFITAVLLFKTERIGTSLLFEAYPEQLSETTGKQPTCEGFIRNVLSGSPGLGMEKWFQEMRQIGPEPVGPSDQREMAPVLEERHAGLKVSPESWKDFMLAYLHLLRDVNRII
jgi:hypothetical protein